MTPLWFPITIAKWYPRQPDMGQGNLLNSVLAFFGGPNVKKLTKAGDAQALLGLLDQWRYREQAVDGLAELRERNAIEPIIRIAAGWDSHPKISEFKSGFLESTVANKVARSYILEPWKGDLVTRHQIHFAAIRRSNQHRTAAAAALARIAEIGDAKVTAGLCEALDTTVRFKKLSRRPIENISLDDLLILLKREPAAIRALLASRLAENSASETARVVQSGDIRGLMSELGRRSALVVARSPVVDDAETLEYLGSVGMPTRSILFNGLCASHVGTLAYDPQLHVSKALISALQKIGTAEALPVIEFAQTVPELSDTAMTASTCIRERLSTAPCQHS